MVSNASRVWSSEEEQYIIDNYKKQDSLEMGKVLQRTDVAVNNRISVLKNKGMLKKAHKVLLWSKEQEEYLIERFGNDPVSKIAKEINQPERRIYNKLAELRLQGKVPPSIRKEWTYEEEQYIIDNYKQKKPHLIADELDVELKQVKNKILFFKKQGLLDATSQYKKAESKRMDIFQKNYKKTLVEEKDNRDYGVGKKKLDIVFRRNQMYLLSKQEGKKDNRIFKGELVQATHNHITFKKSNGIRESFLRNDFLIRDVIAKEV